MIVHVTAEDIANGVRKSYGCCPVAIALSRTLGRVCKAGSWSWWKNGDEENDAKQLPLEARDFIDTFDSEGPAAVEPFDFEVAET